MKNAIFLALVFFSTIVVAQCNGQSEVCSKKFNEVSFLTTHNAFNTGSESFSLPNQNYGIAQQLQDGVRAFMLDVYSLFGNTVVYHGSFALGYQDVQDDLGEIKSFLDANPNEVVTIILECNVSANTIESELNQAGLFNYLYTQIEGQEWATIQEMIDTDKRLVIFTDVDDASASQTWYHYMWGLMVETHYSVNSPTEFTEDYNRGDSLNDLFIFNHFVTNSTIGTGSESDAQVVNEYSFLMDRILTHYDHHDKFPNFVTLDFYDQGDGLSVVQDLNAGMLNVLESSVSFVVYPNPVTERLYIQGIDAADLVSVEVLDLNGKKLAESDQAVINFMGYPKGVYLVKVITTQGVTVERVVHPG